LANFVIQAKPVGFLENFEAFRSAITWSEPFIIGLVTFQIFMFITCLLVSRHDTGIVPRMSVLIFIMVLVRTVEYLNQLASRNWKDFTTQNYFDHKGIFVSFMVSGPLLFDCLMMLMLFVREASGLLVKVKTNEFKRKRKQQQQEEQPNKGDKKKAETTKESKKDK
jgi:transmembrane protein 18